jgi:hypothetical protein
VRQGLPGVTVADLERAGLPPAALYPAASAFASGSPESLLSGLVKGKATPSAHAAERMVLSEGRAYERVERINRSSGGGSSAGVVSSWPCHSMPPSTSPTPGELIV